MTRRALVVGAGIGGLTAGAALAGRGIETDVVETRSAPSALGVGFHLRANALRGLRTIGVLDDIRAVGFEYDLNVFRDYRDALIAEVRAEPGGDGVPATVSLMRPRLHDILAAAAERAGARVVYGTTAVDVAESENSALVTFDGGRQAEYDVVAAFDGINSATRCRMFGATHDAVATGFVIWRAPLPRTEEVDTFTVFMGLGAVAGYCPLGADSMYLFLIAPDPGDGGRDGSRLELLRQRLAGFAGHIAELGAGLGLDREVYFHRLSEVMLPLPWSKGRVIVLGDAAHACNPQGAQGAAMAIEDAVVLAEELTSDHDRPVSEMLAAVGRRRYPRAKYVQDVGRDLRTHNLSITAQDMPRVVERMAVTLPAQRERIDAFLRRPL